MKDRPLPAYYEDDNVVLYHGDCREILPRLAPLDLIVTDPPYGVGYDYGGAHDDSPEAYWDWFLPVLKIMRQCCPQVVFTHRQAALKVLTEWTHLCCWQKPWAMGFARGGWLPHWEPIFIYGAKVTSRSPNARRASHADVYSYNVVKNHPGHPATKPLTLMEDLVGTFSGVVCDPFAGSGTTLVAAKRLGRKSIGIEINEDYCDLIVERYTDTT